MTDHRFTIEPPELHEPRLIVALDGWIDASGAAAAAMGAIAIDTDAQELVEFDDDIFIDFRARRPTLEIRDGVSERLVWARPRLLVGKDPAGIDVLLLTGPEPDMAWHRFASTVVELAERFDVTSYTALGAYPFAAPHTRAVRLSATSPETEVVYAYGFTRSSVDVPAGVAAVLEQAFFEHQITAATLWAQVPHYVSAMSYPAASVALIDALSRVTNLALPARSLRREVEVQRERLDHLVASNDEHAEMVGRLERMHDEVADNDEPGLELRTGDEIAAEVERFLRENPKG